MRRQRFFVTVAGVLALVLLPVAAQGANAHASYRAVCPSPSAGHASCHELVVTDSHGNPLASTAPTGLDPATIKGVYSFPTSLTAGTGQTIAIVDAYDDPTAESDLNTFSAYYGLPACTTANGCFTKVNQTGGTSYPTSNAGWALEISLDVQWAHAIAPGAKILLVEASSNSFANLLAAEDYAAAHAHYVSNSWGGSESSGESSYDSHFVHSGVSFFVSAGDAGLPAEYPSASPNVISVGGTTLHLSGSTFVSETGWSSGGGGCSSYEAANPAQSGFSGYAQAGCAGKRATPDVSLDADPNSGVSVYDSTSYYGQTGWWTVGGTSASSPMWAARSAVEGVVVNAAYVYGTSIPFRDIVSGNNGAPCLVGFDLCSGRGSWAGSTSGGSTSTLTSLTVSPASASTGEGQSVTFTATGTDQNGNPMNVSSATWSLSPSSLGTLSATTGSSTTFTAGSATGSATVTATIDGLTASATVTVTSLATMTVAVNAGTVAKKGPNYRVPLTVTVGDGSSPLGGATVNLAVHSGSCTGPVVASGSGTTGTNGQASFSFSTRQSGGWCALATVSASGYATNTGSATFTTP